MCEIEGLRESDVQGKKVEVGVHKIAVGARLLGPRRGGQSRAVEIGHELLCIASSDVVAVIAVVRTIDRNRTGSCQIARECARTHRNSQSSRAEIVCARTTEVCGSREKQIVNSIQRESIQHPTRELYAELKDQPFFSKNSFASFTLVARYGEPPRSGWFNIMSVR